MINVAYVAVAPFISGSERCLQLILTHCQTVDISPILITPHSSPMKQWAKDNNIIHYSCDLSPFSIKSSLRWLLTQFKFYKILKKNKINVIHSNQIWSYQVIAPIAQLLKIKRVCHFRDPINSGSKWWLKEPLTVAICISKHIRAEYEAIFSKGHAKKVTTLIDPVSFHPPLLAAERKAYKIIAKQKMNIDEKLFTFAFIGQIAPIKGLLELIVFLAKLPNKDWQLIVAGKDPSIEQTYINLCTDKVAELKLEKHVKFIGFVDDTRDFYHAVDIITMFSIEEPLGLIPLEAAVHYTPTIATNVGGLPETIIDGKTGWLVDVNNEADVIEKLTSAMSANLFDYGTAARTWVESVSLPEVHCQALKKLYIDNL
ncbi:MULTISPECIES: glycosyltransferase family 4 protein [Colwellia]|uniref:Glycosyl transferase family 1 n=1 Tax=Colwellia marinimaniae TaxID=1513592 RepID=A0ABQ0MT54_9GAMM|nr:MULTISPECIES: glycosyltransferase family 4 protein [Colwellia]GAW95538.1 glycosyl transferase family 1 [Colwellia marinimaniae]